MTGGSGFLGRNLIRSLKALGKTVVSLSRKPCNLSVPEMNKDLNDVTSDDLRSFGIEAIFHTAAKVGFTGSWSEFFRTNSLGTARLVREAIKAGVKYFVYTSSPSVVFDGSHIFGCDETLPYASKPGSYYARTKQLAEQAVLSQNHMPCVVLRPHLIFGPDDSSLLPAIIKGLKTGKLFRFCDEDFLADFTYIDDCVAAHIQALEFLIRSPSTQQRIFFISSGEPVGIWQFIETVAEELNLRLRKIPLPERLVLWLARLSELKIKILNSEVGLTRSIAEHLLRHHFFDISRARKLLKYNPEGRVLEKLRESLKAWSVC